MAPDAADLTGSPEVTGPDDVPALAGIRVVELSVGRAARWGGRLLAGFGADVMRIEDPAAPAEDHARRTALDCDKRSVALRPHDRRLRLLLEEANVVLLDDAWLAQGPTLETVGLDDPGRRVVGTVSPFGGTGPYADWTADDFVLCALAGWTHTQGSPGQAPTWVGADHLSHLVGAHLAFAVLAAVLHAEVTGTGQCLEVTAHEVALAGQLHNPSGWAATGRVRQRRGNTLSANWLALPVSDGWVAVTGVANWEEFWTVMLATDSPPTNPWLLTDDDARLAATEELRGRVAHLTKRDFFGLGQALKVICAEILEIPEVLTSPQMVARDWPVPHPDLAGVLLPGPPVRLAEGGWVGTGRAPEPGRDTDQVLAAHQEVAS